MEKDDHVIASMNAKRVGEGREPLSEKQEAMVREGRRDRRAEQS